MDSPVLLLTSHVTKEFGSIIAVDSVSLSIEGGQVYALLGKNGAGKSTLLKLITGLLEPTNGSISLVQNDLEHDPVAAKRHFGYVSDDPTAYGYLSGREFLTMTGNIRGMTKNAVEKRLHELIPLFPLKDIVDQQMHNYSRGNRQKVAFLAAVLSKPEVLIIDEPIVGLDPESISIFGEVLRKYVADSQAAVLFATHTLSFAKEYATHVGFMRDGKIVHEEKITKDTVLEKLYT